MVYGDGIMENGVEGCFWGILGAGFCGDFLGNKGVVGFFFYHRDTKKAQRARSFVVSVVKITRLAKPALIV